MPTDFIGERLDDSERCRSDLQSLCRHGHFSLESHLATVKEMLASLGEAHSAWNTATLLPCYIDLTGWRSDEQVSLDERIETASYLFTNLKTVRRIRSALESVYPEAEINQQKVATVSAIGSDLQVSGIPAKAVGVLAESDISIMAMHQSMRQVDMQFLINKEDYDVGIRGLHRQLSEVHDHGKAICLAS